MSYVVLERRTMCLSSSAPLQQAQPVKTDREGYALLPLEHTRTKKGMTLIFKK